MPHAQSLQLSRVQASKPRQIKLWIELIAFYAILPGLIACFVRPERADQLLSSIGITFIHFHTGLPRGIFIFPVLILTFVLMFTSLLRDPEFERKRLWNWNGFRNELKGITARFIIFAPIILGITWVLAFHTNILPRDRFMYLPRELPFLLLAISILYPWVSAYPQEITHRVFFFHRYSSILGFGRFSTIINVVAFVWLHAPMWNLMAFVMTLPAGVLFARTYRGSESGFAVGFEHAIYGVWVFAIGLGYFVFAGN